jgi:hypothetical protein
MIPSKCVIVVVVVVVVVAVGNGEAGGRFQFCFIRISPAFSHFREGGGRVFG